MSNGISLDTYVEADKKTQDRMTFELLQDIRYHQCQQVAKCEVRFKDLETRNRKLENRKWLNTGAAGAGGIIGGIIAVVFKKVFGG